MTRGPAHLQLMQADVDDAGPAPELTRGRRDPGLVEVTGTGPDDGRLAHPATRRRGESSLSALSLLEAEARLTGFVADLLDAPADASARVVAGIGTAALVALRGARDARGPMRYATVVLPASAHPAYFAAAATLGLHPVVVQVDPDGRVPLGSLASAIRDDTVVVVASAPSYTHGVVDPVGWIAAAAAARGVPLHVDAVCGGWAMAYAERAGRVGTSWGFAVGGVDSIAIDVGPESGGAADLTVLVHRDSLGARAAGAAELARGPLPLPTSWERPGALLADVVETLEEMGHDGCAELAQASLQATAALLAGLADQPGIQVAGTPEATVVSLRTDATCDVFTVADGLRHRGWTARPVLLDHGPPLLRLPVTAAVLPVVDDLVAAVAASVADAQELGRAQVDGTLERLLDRLDPEEVRDYSAHLLLDAASTLDRSVVDRDGNRSSTNLLLAAAEPRVRRALLGVHRDRLVRPVRPGGQPAAASETTASTDASE